MFNINMEELDLEKIYDLIVLGGGPTAVGCAIYAKRFAMDVLIIGKTYGGLIATTHVVENYPAITSVSGQGLMAMFKEHMDSLEIPYISDEIKSIEQVDDHFELHSFFQNFKAFSICIATGSVRRKLGIPGEEEFAGKGVSYCATCDGPFYKDKVVCVIGGSDSAAKEALFLVQNTRKVYIVYRGEDLRAEPINKKRVLESENIEIIYNTNVVKIIGERKVSAILLDGGKRLDVDGVFIEIGSNPNSDIAKGIGVETNEHNEIKINRKSETNVPGIFAAGDVADAPFKQAITGVAEGVIAAYSAFDFVKEMNVEY
ncbi:MAG: thioredoxin reductase [Promethearchaeota archaeon]|nr:MAG: thioredoxin reductase [Candidatus Lokiarchaeota archaeon]